MMRLLFLAIICGLSFQLKAQSNIQEILQSVEKNNPELKNQKQLLEAEKLGIRSQFNLANPEFEFENNFSSAEGKPYEMAISQSFDFPTSYIYKKRYQKAQLANIENLAQKLRQDVLLNAQLTCIDLVYQLKQKKELDARKKNALELQSHFQKRLATGESSILELNKIKMLLLNTSNQLSLTENKIAALLQDLKLLNGGIAINFSIEQYPQLLVENNIQTLQEQVLSSDPNLKALNANQEIAQKQTSIVKTNSLPKFKIGYRYFNSDLSDSSTGLKFGMSIPLWENRHKLKKARAMEKFHEEQYALGKMEKEGEITKLFQNNINLKSNLEAYQSIFTEKKYDELLQKSLRFGEISAIEYLMESIYYYESYDTYLEIEHEYFRNNAMILKYKL